MFLIPESTAAPCGLVEAALSNDGGSSVSSVNVNDGRFGSAMGSAMVGLYVEDTFTAPGIGLGGTKLSLALASAAEGLFGFILTIIGDSAGVTGAGAGFGAETGVSDNATRDGGCPREAAVVGDGVEAITLLFDDGTSLECSITGETAG